MHSRPLPQSAELERQVIQVCLLDRDACAYACGALTPEDFYSFSHCKIFETIRRVASQNDYQLDTVLVRESIPDRGGAYEGSLLESYDHVTLSALPVLIRAVETACARLQQLADVRKVIQAAGDLYVGAMTDEKALEDPQTFLDDASSKLTKALQQRSVQGGSRSLAEEAGDIIRDIIEPQNIVDDSIPFALAAVDRLVDRLEPGGLYYLAARPGQGKSAYAWQCCMHAASLDKASVFYPFEMKARQLAERAIAGMASVDGLSMKRRNLPSMPKEEQARVVNACISTERMRIQIADCMGWSFETMLLHARRQRMLGQLDLMVVDYLQLMESKEARGKTPNEAIGHMSKRLKRFAGELGIPVLALSQLNRGAEDADSTPSLKHLRDSGSIEQDADAVIFMHPAQGQQGLTRVTVAKNRSGKTGGVDVRFERQYLRFAEQAPAWQ